MNVTFLGHASFLLGINGKSIAVDPWLKEAGNPAAVQEAGEIDADFILLTHGHDDHVGSVQAIAERTDAALITTFELANHFQEQGVSNVHSMHIGGTRSFDFGRVRVTPALHGSGIPGGFPCGFVVDTGDAVFYHAGDTGLFSDLKLIGELEAIDLAALPIGSNFTMGIDDAVLAAEWLGAREIVPIHYNTFPVIECDPRIFKKKVEERTATGVRILSPGDSVKI